MFYFWLQRLVVLVNLWHLLLGLGTATFWYGHKTINYPPFTVSIPTNSSAWPFFFQGVGNYAKPTFTFYTSFELRFQIIDAFCQGDRFYALFNGQQLTSSSGRYGGEDLQCTIYATDPVSALAIDGYYYIDYILSPGYYNVTIVPFTTFQNNGMAYVRLCMPINTCQPGVQSPSVYDSIVLQALSSSSTSSSSSC